MPFAISGYHLELVFLTSLKYLHNFCYGCILVLYMFSILPMSEICLRLPADDNSPWQPMPFTNPVDTMNREGE